MLDLDKVKRNWGTETGWQARIDFPGHGYINLWRAAGAQGQNATAVVFIDCVSRTFSQKLTNLQIASNE